jgi:pterin-4a-carbinolamine dehydratase
MSQHWQERKRPVRLERRYEFSDYEDLRNFLDEAADLSEKVGIYPDMGFGRDYVNITIHLEEGSDAIAPNQREFAEQLEQINVGSN